MNRADVARVLAGAGREVATDPAAREFDLYRRHDITGLSGTGTVADGIKLSNGLVVMEWHPPHRSLVVWPSLAEVLAVHGHDGATVARFIDEEPT